ncbi:hypothetical protein GIW56_08060 [Pseudomonas gessardii]|uniref:Phage tail protein n=1 Tax=Pseudomonas gessardii TaxID=78544 RepID=A0ABS9F316_9PSED|nr:hypothetical protein [Pseudomonas gessardii]MCF4977388.1 hypothetical protein [Pseudomonas gessardii]MCF4989746.1 hypothetical protein [Pseudomonas gessardii]MCF5083079.1 hypothetical protein [Pseudomonas gessardii]MCF5094740.1 hypothetical protein [Pseudomonas gessardii]MCF5106786.1 hypothetical protein [Pseudomonas gessardii]
MAISINYAQSTSTGTITVGGTGAAPNTVLNVQQANTGYLYGQMTSSYDGSFAGTFAGVPSGTRQDLTIYDITIGRYTPYYYVDVR